MRFIAARYDLTFRSISRTKRSPKRRRHNLPLDVVWLSCGHYTMASMPWKAIDAWKIATFMRKHLR